jgi:alkylation response protein AidB-like acyl-CoA dehydrogenase
MDFTLSDEQQAVADLAGRILTDKVAPERLRDLEQEPEWFARDAWAELAKADLLGLCLPEADGGGGYGVLEACLILEQVGRTVAPVPFLATVVAGAMPVARFGTPEQRAALLPGVISGDTILTAALAEPGDALPPAHPATRAMADGNGWKLTGQKRFVPAGHLAERILVPASTDDGVAVFLVDPTAPGVSTEQVVMTNLEPLTQLDLDGVEVTAADRLGEPGQGAEVVGFITRHSLAGLCSTQAGVCAAALKITAGYTSTRKQFNAPIATFQAVAQRAADAYVDTEAVGLTSRQAAWRLDEGLPADEALAVAKFWAAEGAQRVVHAAQHLHGGIGVDVDYPIHRYFRWAKAGELSLGGGTRHLLELGARLAAEPA